MEANQVQIDAEQLGYWYLRLNGFLTIPNFVVHPDQGRNQETDADILGIRLHYRAENLERPMQDDGIFARRGGKAFVVIAEIKRGLCNLNGPWSKPERRNVLRVLRAVGAFPEAESQLVAKALYDQGTYQNQLYLVSLLCLGARTNSDIYDKYPMVPQILWGHTLQFIYFRFREYSHQKASHPQWDDAGQAIWDAFERSRSLNDFISRIAVS